MRVLTLFTARSVLQSTDCVLHFAGSLVGYAIGFQLFIAKDLPDGFFHHSLGVFCRPFDSIFVHCRILDVYLFGVWGNALIDVLFQVVNMTILRGESGMEARSNGSLGELELLAGRVGNGSP